MEAFGLIRELQALAAANDWKFILGTAEYANIDADFKCDIGQLVLWVDINPNPVRNDGNRLSEINYTGSIVLLGKFDSDGDNYAKLDETWQQKYDRRLEDIQKLFSDVMKGFACSNQLQINSDTYEYVINIFDTNLDGVVGTFEINQDRFSEQAEDYSLEIIADTGGSVLPYEGVQSFVKYSKQAIAAIADDNYDFDKWELLIDGAVTSKTENPLIVSMVNNIVATAKFICNLITIQEVFGTTPIDQKFIDQVGNNDVTYKNVQIAKSDGVSTIVNTGINASNNMVMAFVGRFINPNNDSQFVGGFSTNNRFYIGPTGGEWAFGYGTTFNRSDLLSDDENYLFIVNNNRAWILEPQKLNDDIIKNIIDNITPTLTTNSASEPNPTIDIFGLSEASIFVEMEMQEFALSNYDGNIYTNLKRLNFQDGDDDILIDISGNEDNSLVTGGILADFRGTYIDSIDSVLINNGYTLFRQIADPAIIITAAYDVNGVPTLDANNPPAGYNTGVEIPPNVVSDNRILYDGLQGSISGVNNTYDEINALTSPEYEVTKTTDYISNVKVKA